MMTLIEQDPSDTTRSFAVPPGVIGPIARRNDKWVPGKERIDLTTDDYLVDIECAQCLVDIVSAVVISHSPTHIL